MLEKLRLYSSYIKEKEEMYKYTSLKIGGKADIFLEVSNITNLVSIIDIFNKENIFYFILGGGSNILIKDGGINGGVIRLGGEFTSISLGDDSSLLVSAGASLHKLINYACYNNLSGIENLYGIPGTIGGAIYCRTQAFGRCIFDVINYVKLIERKSLVLYTVSANEIDSLYKKNILSDFIIIEVKLSLKKSSRDRIRLLMDYFYDIRKQRQPIGVYSAGCIFKNPDNGNLSAGWLIEKSGLKGTKYNGACISPIHANFILNVDSAKAADILYLVDLIRNKIRQKFGIELELQVHIYGEDE